MVSFNTFWGAWNFPAWQTQVILSNSKTCRVGESPHELIMHKCINQNQFWQQNMDFHEHPNMAGSLVEHWRQCWHWLGRNISWIVCNRFKLRNCWTCSMGTLLAMLLLCTWSRVYLEFVCIHVKIHLKVIKLMTVRYKGWSRRVLNSQWTNHSIKYM